MSNIIVTGANGFVGSALVKKFASEGVKVIALDRDNKNLPLSKFITYYPIDIADIFTQKEILANEDNDLFFHFAWAGTSGVARANTAMQLNNAQWTIDCLRFAKEIGCKKFIGVGSIMEHEAIAAAFKDGNKPGLGYVYGSGKLVAHTMSKSVAADIGIDIVWAKITNAYGPGEFSPRFINTTLRKIINNEPLKFTSGSQNYDFVYIDDVVDAFCKIAEKGTPFCDYLIGSGNARPLREFIMELKEAVAPDRKLLFGDIPFTGINLPLEYFDCSKTERDTEFKAQVTFTNGIKKTMDWIVNEEMSKK